MKTALKYIIASLCFGAIFFTPADDAPLSTFFIWFIVECVCMYTFYRLCKSEETEDEA